MKRCTSSREPSWPESEISTYDWPYIIAHGKGVFVGAMLAIWNPTTMTTLSGGWWGEGDEKIYVDGEAFPSTFGTGSEDYFGYAWSRPETYEHPFIAQPRCDGPGNRGVTVNGRWHLLDAIPFHRSIEFYMELLHHSRTPGFSYARMAYLYTLPGARDDHIQVTDADLQLPAAKPWTVSPRAFGDKDQTLIEAKNADWNTDFHQSEDVRFSGGQAALFMVGAGDIVSTTVTLPELQDVTFFVAGGADAGASFVLGVDYIRWVTG